MTKREEVARAICAASGKDPDEAPRGAKPLWCYWIKDADAALAAMREPSEAMLRAGVEAHLAEPWDDINEDPIAKDVADDWRNMIDVARNETEAGDE